jgi:hypothetical protein
MVFKSMLWFWVDETVEEDEILEFELEGFSWTIMGVGKNGFEL